MPTASARSSALLATTPCWAAATSTSTPSSSNAPCASSNPAASSACSPPPASTPTETAARFFESVSTTGRVAGIYDFENRRLGTDQPPFFPDIDSRFKFCALIVGGPQRTFPETRCGFFLPDTETIKDPDRAFTLSPDDFARVNPNTGTAPVFRTRRDADLTRRIYRDHPVLVDRSDGREPPRLAGEATRQCLFHMTNDSHLFRTASQLEDEGFYPVQGNRWKRGEDLYLPLYEGKMVQAFDHRAASVVVNPERPEPPWTASRSHAKPHSNPLFCPIRNWIWRERRRLL